MLSSLYSHIWRVPEPELHICRDETPSADDARPVDIASNMIPLLDPPTPHTSLRHSVLTVKCLCPPKSPLSHSFPRLEAQSARGRTVGTSAAAIVRGRDNGGNHQSVRAHKPGLVRWIVAPGTVTIAPDHGGCSC